MNLETYTQKSVHLNMYTSNPPICTSSWCKPPKSIWEHPSIDSPQKSNEIETKGFQKNNSFGPFTYLQAWY